MSALDTYDKLVAEIESWLNREGFASLTAQIPLFVEQGMRRIQKVDLERAMLEVDATFIIDDTVVALPDDFDRVKTFNIVSGSGFPAIRGFPLAKVLQAGINGRTNKYAVVGDNFHFGPTPQQSYTTQLVYYKKLPVPSPLLDTNWILENEPDLLLWSSLISAAQWLKDDKRTGVWQGSYEEVLAELLESEARMDQEEGSLQVTTDRTPL